MKHQFKPGDAGLCHDGVTKYEVLKIRNDGLLIVYLRYRSGREEAVSICNNGWWNRNVPEHPFSLKPPKQMVAGFWVNLYEGNQCHDQVMHQIKDQADDAADETGEKRIACLYYPPREFELGEGL